jgi:hypothetical protein
VGLAMMRDVLYGSDTQGACRCATVTSNQLQIIIDRALARDEAAPSVDVLMDGIVAPIIYRTLFGPAPSSRAHVQALIETSLKQIKGKKKSSG